MHILMHILMLLNEDIFYICVFRFESASNALKLSTIYITNNYYLK